MTRTPIHRTAIRRCCLARRSPARGLLALTIAVAAGLVAPRIARADDTKVFLTVKSLDPKDPKYSKDAAPMIEAQIKNGPKTTIDKFSIADADAKAPVWIKASALRAYNEGTDTIAIAFVINGQEIWIGNEDVETDPNAIYPGVLKNLEAALDKLAIGTRGPPGSKGVVISYNTGAHVVAPMGDLKLVTGSTLGQQKDYYKKIGTDMVQGIDLGIAQLAAVSTARKALIIVGDGNDTNNVAAKEQLKQSALQAKRNDIDLFAIIYKPEGSGQGNVITELVKGAKNVNSIDGIAAELENILTSMADRYYVTFPGYDPKVEAGLPWDGKQHQLTIKIDQTELEPADITMAPVWGLKTAGFPWLLVILISAGVLLLLIIIIVATRKKPQPVPMPIEVPMVAAPAPMPSGPMKTVMMSAGGSDGFPIVGWLVPLNGPNAFQTYKLIQGITKIGTAPPSHIIVNDGFLSTEHCQVVCSARGFELVDNGSTNGCYVNDRKSTKQELVDNDMITLGKTHFKFKSIN